MLILNGKKFAKNNSEFIDSLFQKGGTCVGYYRMLKRQIQLSDINKNRIGGINQHGVLHSTTKLNNGKYWHSYATIKEVGSYDNYSDQIADINKYCITRDKLGYIFK